jgi:hypothetical protein
MKGPTATNEMAKEATDVLMPLAQAMLRDSKARHKLSLVTYERRLEEGSPSEVA